MMVLNKFSFKALLASAALACAFGGTASAAEGAEPASDSDDPLKALQDSLAEEPKQN